MMRMKFNNTYVYTVEGNEHLFRSLHDAEYWCDQQGIDSAKIERFDSKKEYYRWLELQELQTEGKITNLERQVPFEIIPEHGEDVEVRRKTVKWYAVGNVMMQTKAEALNLCKKWGKSSKDIMVTSTLEPVMKYKVIEKNAVYTADFVYIQDGAKVVEDCKSEITRKEADYVLRRKLMLHVNGIRIKET
jgi:hypothetical protein